MLLDIAGSATLLSSHRNAMSNWVVVALPEPLPIEFILFCCASDESINTKSICVQISTDALSWREVNFTCHTTTTNYNIHIAVSCDICIFRFIRICASGKRLALEHFSLISNNDYIVFRGYPLFIKSETISDSVQNALEKQIYEAPEINMALAAIQGSNNIVLELGASLGVVSTIVSKKCSIEKYYCVEANSKAIEIMRINHKINAVDADIIHGVLTNSPLQKEFDFYIHKHCSVSSLNPSPHSVAIEKVKGFYFPDILLSLQPTHIICDIEGGEYELFNSIESEALASVSHIFMEIHPTVQETYDALFQNLVNRCGFALSTDIPKDNKMRVCHFMKEDTPAALNDIEKEAHATDNSRPIAS